MEKNIFVKTLIAGFLFLLLFANVYSQKTTPNPRVDSGFSSRTMEMKITSVIMDPEYTFVTFQYITTLFKTSIELDAETILQSDKSYLKFKILEWGVITEDNNGPFNTLHFDEQYQVKRRVAYKFYMIFPAIPQTSTLLSIEESIKNNFYWRGIHIDDGTPGDLPNDKPDYQQKRGFIPSGSGSGFSINNSGYVATCYHIVAGAKAIRIKGFNGNFENALAAKVIATDVKNDLAILKINGAHFSQAPYFFATQLSDVGENIFVLGYPQTQHLGEELKLTTGVISSRSGYKGDISTYQISAQVLPGNSGCPLFDDDGEVIGVVSAKYIEPNVSYAVKLTYLKTLIENSKIRLSQPINNTIIGKSLADKVKLIRNFIYIIDVKK